jgi:hypothetical protein
VRKVTSPRSTVAVVVAEPETREAAAYGRFVGAPSSAQLERFFFLDDADSRLVANRLGRSQTGSGSRCNWAPCGCSARFRATRPM